MDRNHPAADPRRSPSSSTGSSVTTDTLLLAASVSVPPESEVFELGCGSGAALVTAAERNPGCTWTGLDIQEDLLAEARKASARPCGTGSFRWILCPVESVPSVFSRGVADAVIANPPYMVQASNRPSPSACRRTARSAPPLLLQRFIRAASHLLREDGTLVMVNRPENLTKMLLGFLASEMAPVLLQPVGDPDRPAELILLSGLKGSSRDLSILPQREAGSILDDAGLP